MENKLLENKLNFLRNKFEILIKTGLDCIFIISSTGETKYISESIKTLWGYDPDELLTMDLHQYVHPCDLEDNLAIIQKAIENPGVPIHGNLSRVKNVKGEWRWVDSVVTNMINDPIINGIVHHFRDVTERVLAEQEENEYKERLLFATQGAEIGVWERDLITSRLIWNNRMFELLGLKKDNHPEELEFGFGLQFVHPDDKERVEEEIEIAMEGKVDVNSELRIIKGDGSIRHIKASVRLKKDKSGKPIRLIGAIWDITASRKANDRFKDLLESAPDAMVIVNEQGRMQLVNKQTEKMFGYNREELLNQSVELLVPNRYLGNHHAYRKFFFANPKKLITKAGEELYGKTKNGVEIPIQISLSPLETEDGLLVSAAIRDITAEKLAKEELLRKNELLNFAEKITMMGNWKLDMRTNILELSANLYHLFELEPKSIVTYEIYLDLVHPEDKEMMVRNIDEAFNDKKNLDLIHRIQLKDSKMKIIHFLANVHMDDAGNVIEMVGTCQDVTKQKIEENKFKGLLESAPDATFILNRAAEIQLINKAAEKLFDYSREELLGKSVTMLFPEKSMALRNKSRNKFLSNPETMKIGEDEDFYGKCKSGKIFPIEVSLSPLETEDGLLVSAAIRNITKQKSAEAELLRRNQLLNFAEKITMMGNWQWNTVTNDVKWSANLYHIFGVAPDIAITYDTYFGFVHPEDKEKVAKHVETSLKSKNFFDLIHRIKLEDGTVKIVQLLAEVNTDERGKVIEMLGACQDVTKQRMEEAKFRGLVESAPDAMVIINENDVIELVNSETERMFGYSKLDLIGKPVDILLPDNFERNLSLYKKNPVNFKFVKKEGNADLYGIKKEGLAFPVEINLGTLDTDEGFLISAAIRDVTERRKTEAMLRKMAVVEAKNKEMEELTYITSHDLREPLLTAKKYSEVLHKMFYETLGDDGRTLLETIIRSADRMEAKINHLLDYSQLGQVRNLEIVDSKKIVEIVIEDLYSLIETNEADIIIGDLPTEVKAYSTELQLIFQNLINNAIKFRAKDRKPIVSISSEKIAEGWRFEVADNGIGINEKNYKKIFSIFQRLNKNSEYEGSGIGLAHVKKLVELHNGQIKVKSKEGEGTSFSFSINKENI